MILIISDYHHKEDEVIRLIEKYQPEYTLCCGDGESDEEFYQKHNIISVKGNCDYINLPTIKLVELYNNKILLTHGHLYDVHFDIFKLYLLAKEQNAKYVFFGHTHRPFYEEYEGVIIVNPGALKDGNYALFNGERFIFK